MATEILQAPNEEAGTSFDALLTDDEVKEIEEVNKSWGRQRRVALATLSRSKAQLLEGFERNPEDSADVLMEMFELVSDYRKHLDGLVEQADCAKARLFSVLSTINESGRI